MAHSEEEEEEAKRQAFAVPIDLTGKLSAPFLLGNRAGGGRERRNTSRGATVTWKDLSDVQADEVWKRGSKSSEEDKSPSKLSRKSSRYESDREPRDKEKARERERDSGSSGSRHRRSQERRELEDQKVRPLLRERRSWSHEDVSRGHRGGERDGAYERERDRERDKVFNGREIRERHVRDRRGASPVRGVAGRKYPSVR
jgi:hypothetical protein